MMASDSTCDGDTTLALRSAADSAAVAIATHSDAGLFTYEHNNTTQTLNIIVHHRLTRLLQLTHRQTSAHLIAGRVQQS